MNKSRLALIALAVVAGAFLAGLLSGGSGRTAAEHARDEAEVQLHLERARVAILNGRIAIFNSNFGEASQHFGGARTPVQATRDRLNAMGRTADAGRLESALALLAEAQKLALALNRDADQKATEALHALVVNPSAAR